MATDIFTYWDSTDSAPPRQAELLRLWERSWSARGWNPRILTIRNAREHAAFKQAHPAAHYFLALEMAGGGYYADVRSINYSLLSKHVSKPRRKKMHIIIPPRRYLEEGWLAAPVVWFDNRTPEDVVNCGRVL